MLEIIATICEIIMVICFGLSWPFNIIRSYKAKSTKGTSILFMSLIEIGYVAGIICKILIWISKGSLTLLQLTAFIFYCINFTMVFIGILIYFRNKKIEKLESQE